MNDEILKAIEALGKRISDLEIDLKMKDYEIEKLKKNQTEESK